MARDENSSGRLKHWRDPAAEIAQEEDYAKLLALVRQLCDAVDKQALRSSHFHLAPPANQRLDHAVVNHHQEAREVGCPR
jgi:LPS sulfotransferase NodH